MSLKVVVNDNIHASVPSAHISTSISGSISTPSAVEMAVQMASMQMKNTANTNIKLNNISKTTTSSKITMNNSKQTDDFVTKEYLEAQYYNKQDSDDIFVDEVDYISNFDIEKMMED